MEDESNEFHQNDGEEEENDKVKEEYEEEYSSDNIDFDISKMKFPKTTAEMFAEIPLDLMKTDDHPLCKLVDKADESFYDLMDSLDELSAFFRNTNENLNLFPHTNLMNTENQLSRAHFDGVLHIEEAK